MHAADSPDQIYYPKIKLQNDHPGTIARSTTVRTLDSKLILLPDGQSELFEVAGDPRELKNVYGDNACRATQAELESRLLLWYLHTTDVALRKTNPRCLPPKN